MGNQNNQWEYDYSDLYGSSGSGYPNAGSSGTNNANRCEQAETASAQPGEANAWAASGAQEPEYRSGGATGYGGSYYGSRPEPKQKKPRAPRNWKALGKKALSLALVFAVGFGGGWLGAAVNGGGADRVIVQTVQRGEGAVGTTTSTGGTELTLAQVAAQVSPSVVVITTEAMVSTGSWFGVGQVQSGAGSGVILSEDGYILTCAHVITGAANIIVTIDGTDYPANLIGEDAESDIAVVKIDAKGLVPAVLADSDALVVGEEVVAVGNPLGELGGTVTNGIVSALNRSVVVQDTEMTLIQTNASVSPGNSGGGLFNMAGELIGIVNAKSADEDAEGLGFAIPVNTALQVATDLVENGYVNGRPALGVTVMEISDAETAAYYGVTAYGVYVADLTKGGGADKAGVQVGDRIVAINGKEVNVTADLTGEISGRAVGDVVTLSVARSGQILTLEVTLGDRNAAAGAQGGSSPSGGQKFEIPGFGGQGRG